MGNYLYPDRMSSFTVSKCSRLISAEATSELINIGVRFEQTRKAYVPAAKTFLVCRVVHLSGISYLVTDLKAWIERMFPAKEYRTVYCMMRYAKYEGWTYIPIFKFSLDVNKLSPYTAKQVPEEYPQ